ncbi:KamA family radical SAM protein [Simkania sp.]|uniref:KamA family radical SAM protein n=1 Tax=Simkania sp. TaxID=34094 RepID=UPI003B521557
MEQWRQIQKNNFRNWKPLAEFLKLDLDKPFFSHPHFPLNLPRRLAEKIEKKTLNDPILLQFFPHQKENVAAPGFLTDPVEDTSFQKTPRLLKKYEGRVLLIVTSACAMHCRFCFRQNYPYNEPPLDFSRELEVIQNDSSIHEVILSGGDPLSLSDQKLGALIEQLSAIPHLKLLRFHTRFPIGIPERITSPFLDLLENTRLQTFFLLHTNHPLELDADVLEAMKRVQKRGIPVLTQTVLIRDVNDNATTLKELFLKLATHGIVPYYLHQLDRVQGAAHFEVATEKGLQLIEQLRKQLPGYAVPTYVQEVHHHKSKTPLTSLALSADQECLAPFLECGQ